MEETGREGRECGASEESITVHFTLLCRNVFCYFVYYCFLFGSRTVSCIHTHATFSLFMLCTDMRRRSTYLFSWRSCNFACHFYHLLSSCLQGIVELDLIKSSPILTCYVSPTLFIRHHLHRLPVSLPEVGLTS